MSVANECYECCQDLGIPFGEAAIVGSVLAYEESNADIIREAPSREDAAVDHDDNTANQRQMPKRRKQVDEGVPLVYECHCGNRHDSSFLGIEMVNCRCCSLCLIRTQCMGSGLWVCKRC